MASHAPEHPKTGHRILVVDDVAYLRDAVVAWLETQGFLAAGAENGTEALRMMRDGFRPCLIILDLMMPGMDGWEFRAQQRQDPAIADVPLVVLTAAVNPASEAKRLGAVAGLHKPVELRMLLSLAAKHCPSQPDW